LIKTIEVEICGQRYSVKGDADEAYVKRLAGYVEEQMKMLAQGMKTATMSKLAVLAAINIAHQLFQAQQSHEQGQADLDRRAASLMESIEEQLQLTRKG
jgi:cell division protein ZapA